MVVYKRIIALKMLSYKNKIFSLQNLQIQSMQFKTNQACRQNSKPRWAIDYPTTTLKTSKKQKQLKKSVN